jgi:hypothetical protein
VPLPLVVGVALEEGVAVPAEEPDGVNDAEAPLERLAVGEGVAEGVRLPDLVAVADRVELSVRVPEGVGDGVLVAVAEREGDCVPEPLSDGVPVAELPEDAVPVFDGVALGVHVGDGELLAVPERETVPESERVRVPEGVGDGVRDMEGVTVGVGDSLRVVERELPEDGVPEPVPLLEGDPEELLLGVRDGETVGVVVTVGLTVREPVAVPEAVLVPDFVGEPLLDALAATGSTNSPCVARPVPKLRPTSD